MDFDSLWSQNLDDVERAIRQVCAAWHVDADASQDLAQELRICLLEHEASVLRAYRGRSAVGTYLYRVMARRAGRWVRRRTRAVAIEKTAGNSFESEAEQSTKSQIPESSIADHTERNRAALYALRGLTSVEQELIHLRFWRGLHWDEVAAFTGMSRKAAENRLYRALGKLRLASLPPGNEH